jgi:uncharacterized protein
MFKWLIVIAVVVLAYAWWRQQRLHEAARRPPAPPRPAAPPAEMVACRHCGVHLPVADAVRGQRGLYCSDEHRQHAEG